MKRESTLKMMGDIPDNYLTIKRACSSGKKFVTLLWLNCHASTVWKRIIFWFKHDKCYDVNLIFSGNFKSLHPTVDVKPNNTQPLRGYPVGSWVGKPSVTRGHSALYTITKALLTQFGCTIKVDWYLQIISLESYGCNLDEMIHRNDCACLPILSNEYSADT